jgi:hypothetical protein
MWGLLRWGEVGRGVGGYMAINKVLERAAEMGIEWTRGSVDEAEAPILCMLQL